MTLTCWMQQEPKWLSCHKTLSIDPECPDHGEMSAYGLPGWGTEVQNKMAFSITYSEILIKIAISTQINQKIIKYY